MASEKHRVCECTRDQQLFKITTGMECNLLHISGFQCVHHVLTQSQLTEIKYFTQFMNCFYLVLTVHFLFIVFLGNRPGLFRQVCQEFSCIVNRMFAHNIQILMELCQKHSTMRFSGSYRKRLQCFDANSSF